VPGTAMTATSQPATHVTVAAPDVRVYVGDEEITSRVRVQVQQALGSVAGAVNGGVRI
jgi:hypothetical protein